MSALHLFLNGIEDKGKQPYANKRGDVPDNDAAHEGAYRHHVFTKRGFHVERIEEEVGTNAGKQENSEKTNHIHGTYPKRGHFKKMCCVEFVHTVLLFLMTIANSKRFIDNRKAVIESLNQRVSARSRNIPPCIAVILPANIANIPARQDSVATP